MTTLITRRAIAAIALAAAATGTLAENASASTSSVNINFTRITNNSPVNVASQFLAVLSQVSGQPNRVVFTFSNSAAIASSISEIYYDNRNSAPLQSLLSPLQQTGCHFTAGSASPGNLPGGNAIGFNATRAFSADAVGNPSVGLDTAADRLSMTFQLKSGFTFNNVVNALNNGDLRLGLHVRAINPPQSPCDWSDSFVSTVAVVPLPPAAWAGLATLGGIVSVRRLRRR